MLVLLDVGTFFENSQNGRQITATHHRTIPMLPNPPKCHMQHKSSKSKMFIIRTKAFNLTKYMSSTSTDLGLADKTSFSNKNEL